MAGLTNIKNQALTERIEDHLFQYILDENGNKVTQAAPIFGTEDFGGCKAAQRI